MSSVKASPLFLFLLFNYLPATALSQNQLNSPSGPTILQCGPGLLQLAPCAPFVQGVATLPTKPCCNNLRLLYDQQPSCLCLLLHDTAALSAFAINTRLALQLPLICSIHIGMSTCSGMQLPSTPPTSQVSFGTTTNSTFAASPMVVVTPRTNFIPFGFHQGLGIKLKPEGPLLLLIVVLAAMASI